ncbi:HDOD domain-containing protein [Anaerobacillus sp. HL2]|nr:HDOD domain-containing protein [Anaerobacillus sp. HL2]
MFQEAKRIRIFSFQAVFFSKPTIITTSDIPIYFHNYIQLLSEINEIDPDIAKIAKLIEVDVSLSYKLLKLVNLAAFSLRAKVHSIKTSGYASGLYERKVDFCFSIERYVAE